MKYKSKKVVFPTQSQLRRTRMQIMDSLFDKSLGFNTTFFTALFGCSKKTTVTMWKAVKEERRNRNDQNQQ